MRFKIPLTGTVIAEDPDIGDPDDPVRIIDIDLGDVSWRAVAFDLDAGLVEVELDAPPRREKETAAEHQSRRTAALAHVRSLLLDHTVDELYERSGSKRLRRPFKR